MFVSTRGSLRSLFIPPPPSIQFIQQDVSTILEKCGDIDDAIRQLTSLKLTFQESADSANTKVAAEVAAGGASPGAFLSLATLPVPWAPLKISRRCTQF